MKHNIKLNSPKIKKTPNEIKEKQIIATNKKGEGRGEVRNDYAHSVWPWDCKKIRKHLNKEEYN